MGDFIAAHPDCVKPRRTGVATDRIVLHTMEGTMAGTIAWFRQGIEERARGALKARGVPNPTAAQLANQRSRTIPTAAHFCVGRDGRVVQMVLERDKALHAGGHGFNDRSIGIELEARIDAWAGPFLVNEFPDAMLDAAAELVADIVNRRDLVADRTHIIGHAEVPGATHRDPGTLFPWDDFMARVGAAMARAA